MEILTVDFGSTYTKLALVDSDNRKIIATASSFTTIETDVMEGFNSALVNLEKNMGRPVSYDKLLSCSSAAGGLKMIALGLVPSLTAKAAKMAASSAGAKVVKTYSYEISQSEQEEIYNINPDLVLLCGGTDGGNKEVIIANAKHLSAIDRPFAIVAAGNKIASYEIEAIFAKSNKKCVVTDNVMPEFNRLNIVPARKCIMDLFISRIIDAKGLSLVQEKCEKEIIPTPLAVLKACELLSKGTLKNSGWGDIMAVDLGGATTDVYSMASGDPTISNVTIKGIPEPYNKRTVEGDLGMRYSLKALLEESNSALLAHELNIDEGEIVAFVDKCSASPDTLAQPNTNEQIIEEGLANKAIDIAVERHCGTMKKVFTPCGEIYALNGKDLSEVPVVIGIGGAILNSTHPKRILEGTKFSINKYECAKPKTPKYYLDQKYIMASMGLLSQVDPDLALDIMKKEIIEIID